MDKIHWHKNPSGSLTGLIEPWFKIYKSNGQLILFIMADRPESIPIKSERQGKIRAKKYLDAKLYEMYGA